MRSLSSCFFFFFNDTATTEIYTLSLHDALPILHLRLELRVRRYAPRLRDHLSSLDLFPLNPSQQRSEEHTSELQSRLHLVCRLLLEKKKKHLLRIPSTVHATAATAHGSPAASLS